MVRQNTSTNNPFDTSIKLGDNLVPYSILPVDVEIDAFLDLSGNLPILGFNANYLDQGIVA